LSNRKHTLWTSAFALTGAARWQKHGREREAKGEHLTDHLAGGVTGDGIVIGVPVGGLSCQMVW
jgi:hypothetical protein